MNRLYLFPILTAAIVGGILVGLDKLESDYDSEGIHGVTYNDHLYWRTDGEWYKARLVEDNEGGYTLDLKNIVNIDIMNADVEEVEKMLSLIEHLE